MNKNVRNFSSEDRAYLVQNRAGLAKRARTTVVPDKLGLSNTLFTMNNMK